MKMVSIPVTKEEESEELISREDAEAIFRNTRKRLNPQDYKSAEEFNTRDLMLLNAEQMIHLLPSKTPRRGMWIEKRISSFSNGKFCSCCDNLALADDNGFILSVYCPHCGAKMRETGLE